jgi:sporulation protein YlmC with PRC-barrel domain
MRRPGSLEVACLLALLAAAPAGAQTTSPVVQRVPATQAATILGRRVLDHAGDQIGRVVDVLVDDSGRPVAAVLDVGGYMGLGSRKVAVDWARLRLTIAGDDTHVTADLNGDTIAATPEYKGGAADTPVLTGPAPKQ